MIFQDRVDAFITLREILNNSIKNNSFCSILKKVEKNNPWFVKEHVQYAIVSICHMINKKKIEKWLCNYNLKEGCVKKIGVIVPSNVPLVGFYDFLCVLLSGNIFVGRLSVSNNVLLPFLAKLLIDINSNFKNYIFFKNDLSDVDLLIATGDDNSATYFKYLFSSTPKIIRKHRNSICVLDGFESNEDYLHLMNDMLMYYGLGCRNISKIYIPVNYEINILKDYIQDYFNKKISTNYLDNYMFQKTKHILNKINFLDCNHTLLTASKNINSPIGVIYYEFYNNVNNIAKHLKDNNDIIQCVVSNHVLFERTISFGKCQMPELNDVPDGVDVMQFLCSN